MAENSRKCLKCGRSSGVDSDTTLFRFPKPGITNSDRCESWAKYCFPEGQWSSMEFQKKLHSDHRMLCEMHFKRTSFSDYPLSTKKLHGFAVPQEMPSEDETEAIPDSGIAASDPVSYPSTTEDTQSSAPNPISPEPLMDVEYLEEEILSPLGVKPEPQTLSPRPSVVMQPDQSDTQPEPSLRRDGSAQRSTLPSRRSMSQRPIRRDERVPRWAYDIERRRIAAEERHAAAMEAMVALVREIRDEIHSFVHRTS